MNRIFPTNFNKRFKAFWATRAGKAFIFLAGAVVSTLIFLSINHYLQRENIQVKVGHLTLDSSSLKHIYTIEIDNQRNKAIMRLGLRIEVQGIVFSSTFDGRITTHIPQEIEPLYSLDGQVVVNETDYVQTLNVEYSSKETNNNAVDLSNQSDGAVSNESYSFSPKWYDVSLGTFSLEKGEKKIASVYLNHEIDISQIQCRSEANIFSPKEIFEIPSNLFQSVLTSLSTASGTTDSKIYVEGIGLAREANIEHTRISARNKAIANLYKEIAQKLYGINVNSQDNLYMEEEKINDEAEISFSFSSKTEITTSGVIDKQSVIIYSEIFKEQLDGSILCILKAFYKLPWEISKPISLKSDFLSKQITEPISEQGDIPSWVLEVPQNPYYLYATSVGSANLDRFVAIRLAVNQAIAEIARQVEVKVQGLTKFFYEEIGSTEDPELISLFSEVIQTTVNTSLKNITVRKYFFSENGEVYVLVEMPIGYAAEVFTSEIKRNEDMYQRFRASEAFKELEEEVKKYEQLKKEKQSKHENQ